MHYKTLKRFFDIVISIILLVLFFPLLAVIALLIFLEDGDEIFVRNPLRIGLNGNEFFMYKFRSMIPNAHNEIENNPKYSKIKKLKKIGVNENEVITKIGKILRKTDLDELPQLINVLKGEMSLVGPRPAFEKELEKHYRKYPKDKKYLKDIVNVRPGITGIWQVSGRNRIHMHARLKMDSKYSKNVNILTDIKILLKTPYIVLSRKGVYE